MTKIGRAGSRGNLSPPSPEHHNMLRYRPRGFRAKQLVYRQLYHDHTEGWMFSVIDKPLRISVDFDIDAYAATEAVNAHPQYDQDLPQDTPLGIKLSRHSYVMIELDTRLNYYFNPDINTPGIDLGRYTVDHPRPKSLYGGLRHVSVSGRVSADPLPKCRLAFFAALNAGSNTRRFLQSINFNLVDSSGTAISVDPDIRYPGVGDS